MSKLVDAKKNEDPYTELNDSDAYNKEPIGCRCDGTLEECKNEPWRIFGLEEIQTGHRLNFES